VQLGRGADVQVEQPGQRQVDLLDLREVDAVAQTLQALELGRAEGQGGLGAQCRPRRTVERPDILIVEGLNVLQTSRLPRDGRAVPFVSDFFDFSIYLDADETVIRDWYIARFQRLRETAFRDPQSFFHRYASIGAEEAEKTAIGLWTRINRVNLFENILPTRPRANLILSKGANHRIEQVALRRL